MLLKVVAECSDFIVAVNVDVLIEIAGVANFTGDGDEASGVP